MTERDTQPAPPLSDEVTRPDHQVPVLPSPTELLDAVGEFSREMRDSLQQIRTAVQDSNTTFLASLDALEKRFNLRLQNLTDEVSRVHQFQVELDTRVEDHEIRISRIELNMRLSEAP